MVAASIAPGCSLCAIANPSLITASCSRPISGMRPLRKRIRLSTDDPPFGSDSTMADTGLLYSGTSSVAGTGTTRLDKLYAGDLSDSRSHVVQDAASSQRTHPQIGLRDTTSPGSYEASQRVDDDMM